MMTRILIVGASGFLGTKLFDTFSQDSDNEVIGTYSSHPVDGLVHLDITNEQQVREVINSFRPDIVIHTSAFLDVVGCEQNPEKAEQINHIGTQNIVEACRAIGARVHYLSTDYVFDGENGPYREEDTPRPINVYGETKLRGEQEVLSLPGSVVYRAGFLYGYNDDGPSGLVEKLFSGQTIEANDVQMRQPLFIEDVAKVIHSAIAREATGIFHLAGPESMSKFTLAFRLAQLVKGESRVRSISETPGIVRKPKDASLITTKAERELGISFTPLTRALEIMRTEIDGRGKEGPRRRVER